MRDTSPIEDILIEYATKSLEDAIKQERRAYAAYSDLQKNTAESREYLVARNVLAQEMKTARDRVKNVTAWLSRGWAACVAAGDGDYRKFRHEAERFAAKRGDQ